MELFPPPEKHTQKNERDKRKLILACFLVFIVVVESYEMDFMEIISGVFLPLLAPSFSY